MTPEERNQARQYAIKLDKSLWHIRCQVKKLLDDKKATPEQKQWCIKLLIRMAERDDLLDAETPQAEPVMPTSIADLIGEE